MNPFRLVITLVMASAVPLSACTPEKPPAPTVSSQPAPAVDFVAKVQRLSVAEPKLRAFSFADEQHGWLAVDATVMATADGGQSWESRATLRAVVRSLDFISATEGWAATETGLLTTRDGGETWLPVPAPAQSIGQVDFVGSRSGWILGADGTAFQSGDGGQTWTPLTLPCGPLRDRVVLSRTSAATGFVACAAGQTGGADLRQIHRTDDGGVSWALVATTKTGKEPGLTHDGFGGTDMTHANLPGSGTLAGLSFAADAAHGWMSSDGGEMQASPDGGRWWWDGWGLWKPEPRDVHIGQVQVLTAEVGYAIQVIDGHPTLVATSDGNHFRPLYPGPRPAAALPRQLLDEKRWVAVATPQNLLAFLWSDDSGQSWRQSLLPYPAVDVMFAGERTGWAIVGETWSSTTMRTVYRWTEGSGPWEAVGPATQNGLGGHNDLYEALAYVSADDAYIACSNGALYRSHEGGAPTKVEGTGPEIVDGLVVGAEYRFTDLQHGWRLRQGHLAATTDGAATWSEVQTGHAQVLQAEPLPGGKGWILAADCQDCRRVLLYTTDDGRQWGAVDLGDLQPAGIRFADAATGVLSDDQGHLYQTTDGGHIWLQLR